MLCRYKINVGKSNDRPDSDYYSKPMKPLKPAKNLNRISNNGIGKVLSMETSIFFEF